MKDIVIISVAFGPRYIEQQSRLVDSVRSVCPDVPLIVWSDILPRGSRPFHESLYGFKCHAVKAAQEQRYKKIIFLDPACIVANPIDYYFTLGLPVIAAKDDNLLINHIGKKARMYFNSPNMTGWHLVGGSLYVFDFNHPDCQKIFNTWCTAEAHGIFGSQQEQASGQINKHRNDESCMAMALYTNGYEPLPLDVCKYSNGSDSIIIKKHFK